MSTWYKQKIVILLYFLCTLPGMPRRMTWGRTTPTSTCLSLLWAETANSGRCAPGSSMPDTMRTLSRALPNNSAVFIIQMKSLFAKTEKMMHHAVPQGTIVPWGTSLCSAILCPPQVKPCTCRIIWCVIQRQYIVKNPYDLLGTERLQSTQLYCKSFWTFLLCSAILCPPQVKPCRIIWCVVQRQHIVERVPYDLLGFRYLIKTSNVHNLFTVIYELLNILFCILQRNFALFKPGYNWKMKYLNNWTKWQIFTWYPRVRFMPFLTV